MKILFAILLLICSNAIAQTTVEEYNYLTKGYPEQLEKGLDVKQGYTFGETITIVEDKVTFDFTPLLRNGKELAAVSLRVRVDKAIDSDIFMCIPINNPDLKREFDKQVSKRFVQWLGEAYAKASSQVIAKLLVQ